MYLWSITDFMYVNVSKVSVQELLQVSLRHTFRGGTWSPRSPKRASGRLRFDRTHTFLGLPFVTFGMYRGGSGSSMLERLSFLPMMIWLDLIGCKVWRVWRPEVELRVDVVRKLQDVFEVFVVSGTPLSLCCSGRSPRRCLDRALSGAIKLRKLVPWQATSVPASRLPGVQE